MGIKSLYTTNKVLEKLSLVHFCTVLNCFLFITTPRTKLKSNLRSGSTFIYSTKGFVFVNAS